MRRARHRPRHRRRALHAGEPAVVAYVNDGDTLRTTSGRRVRLVQIDAPELHGDCYGKAALAALRRLAPKGARITLVRDPALDATDRYGRQLRYVFVSGTNVNVALVRQGAASPYFFREGARPVRARPARRRRRGARRPARLLGCLPAGRAEHRPWLDHRARLTLDGAENSRSPSTQCALPPSFEARR